MPKTLSRSCDQAIFVDQATDASLSSDVVLLKVDQFAVIVFTAVTLGALAFARDQSRVAVIVEAAATVCGAASSLAGLLWRYLRHPASSPDAPLVSGSPVVVPAGQLPLAVPVAIA